MVNAPITDVKVPSPVNNTSDFEYRVMPEVAQAADIALKHKLYVSGWHLSGILKYFRKAEYLTVHHCKIALAFHNEVPIAVATMDVCGVLCVFVRKAYRRKSIGSNLIQALRPYFKDQVFASYGAPGSLEFWEKHKVQTYYD